VSAPTRSCRPRGLSLLELVLALAMVSAIGLASAGLLRAASAAAERREGTTESLAARSILADRLATESLACRSAVAVADELLVLWRGELRRNGLLDASELVFVRFDADRGTLELETWSYPGVETLAGRVAEPSLDPDAVDPSALRSLRNRLAGDDRLLRRTIAELVADASFVGTADRPALRARFFGIETVHDLPIPLAPTDGEGN